MIKKIKELINQNDEIKKALIECDDDVILKNQGIIISALDKESQKPGYKIALSFNKEENVIEWSWVPNNKKTKDSFKINEISSKYTYKLKNSKSSNYLLHLNDVNWTENKRQLSSITVKIIDMIRSKKIPEKGFWLKGDSGSGKTFYGISLLNTIAKEGYKVALIDMRDLKERTQKSFNDQGSYFNYENSISDADILIIDDFGYERPTPWFKESILLPILSDRVQLNKITIFMSTISLSKYKNILDYTSNIMKITDSYDKTEKEIDPQFQENTNKRIINRINQLIDKEVEI